MDENEILLVLPTIYAKDKPVLFDAQGYEVQIIRKVGFAGHPEMPTAKLKGKKP